MRGGIPETLYIGRCCCGNEGSLGAKRNCRSLDSDPRHDSLTAGTHIRASRWKEKARGPPLGMTRDAGL